MRNNNKKMQYKFLIATEGKKDEPNYLKRLRDILQRETNERIPVHHICSEKDIKKIFNKFQKELKEEYYTKGKLDDYAIPCIFVDMDSKSHSLQDMQKLINNCEKENFHIFISHECFEQWLQYHLKDKIISTGNTIKQNLKDELGQKFEKTTFQHIEKAYTIAKDKAKSSSDEKYCLKYTGSDIWRFLDLFKKKFPALHFEKS